MRNQLRGRFLALVAVCALSACTSTASDTQMVGLVFDPGADTAELAGQISGDESVMYRFQAEDGQFLSVGLQPNSQDVEFILYAPGRWPGEVVFATEAAGGRAFEGQVEADGVHAVEVFQSPQASQRGETSAYEIDITLRD